MNLLHHSLFARCVALVILILLIGGLVSCAATQSAPLAPPLSTLRVVMDDNYPPYAFRDAEGNVQGILVDQWKLWEERTGVKVIISALPWGEALERMKAGEFDAIDTIFYTDERAQIFDFTAPYARIDVPIFFQNNISGIADAGDLKGFRVAVKAGDANADDLESRGITDLTYYNSYEAIVQAAARREETIFVIDQPPALYFLYKYGIQDQFNRSAPLPSSNAFHRAVNKGNSAVLNLVTDGFSRISSAEYEAIDRRWLGTGETANLQQFIPYMVSGAVVVLVIVLVLIALNRTLQQRVRQRTQELEKTAEALHESRRFLADLIEYSGALIFVKDREGHYELINRKWEAVTGLTRDEVIGHTDEVLFPGPIGQQFRANDLEVIESGNVLEREEILDDASGRRSFISIKFPVRGEDGHIKGICGMTTEITERKRAEEALAESEEIFRLFMEHSPIYVFFKDEQTRSLRLSKNYEHMLGRPVSELLGKTMDELFPSDLAKSMIADDLRLLSEGNQLDVLEELNGRVYKTTKFPIIRPGRPSWLAGYTIDITEQTRAAEALRQSEDKFSKAFHISPDSININRLSDGLYLEINEGFTTITGYTGEDVKGKTSLDLNIWVNPGDRARLVQGLREHGEVSNLEASFRKKNGRTLTGLMSARIIEVAGEKCILTITRDITDRKRAEEALRASEERYQNFISQSFEGISRTEFDHPIDITLPVETQIDLIYENAYIAECNQALADIYRMPSAETLIGARLVEMHGGNDNPMNRAAFRRLIENGYKSTGDETVEYRADGEPAWFLSNTVGTVENGYLVRLWGTALDVTERKGAEEALRRNEERYRSVFENTPLAVAVWDTETRILEWNQRAEEMLGYTRDEALGQRFLDLIIPPDERVDRSAAVAAVLAQRYQITRNHNLTKSGQLIDGEWHNTVLHDVHGQLLGVISLGLDITARQQAETALRESEEKFRAMIEEASEGFVLIDEHGLIIEWNRAQERILGLTREEVLGRPAYDVQFQILALDRRTPERYETLKALVLEPLQTGQSPLFHRLLEAELDRPDGQRVVIQQSVFPIKTGQGYRLASMSLDITERKRADATLKESEQKMRAIVDAAPFGAHLYELEPGGRLVFKGANHSADQILRLDHQQFIGKTIEEAFPPLIETEIPAAYRRVAATGEQFQMDQIAYDDAGISGAFELHAFQTGPNQMAVFFRDVTERKQMEEALRISLEKYRVLFESFPLGISITDSAGKILESNLQAEKLLDVPRHEHEQRTYDAPEWKFVRSDGTPMPAEEYASTRAMRENQLIQNIEMGYVKEHGAITWLSVTAAPIPLQGYGVAIAYGDITRHKEIEDEIRRLNEDLEQRVAERTRELAAANARLTELDQLKSKFVSDVSHELRTPIANLKLYIDLLDRGKPDKQAHYVTVLQQQVRRVAALVDDILDLSRLERRKEQGLIYRAVALNDVVDQVVLAHQPRAEADGLLLTFEPAAQLPPVRADANQLAQVVTNLITNALSYTSAGYVRVSTLAENTEVCLCVADSGSGIAPDDLPHVFERFYRGQHVLKNDVPGTGLGLAIVKEIVDLHEGRIEVDSQPGHGTTFRVWLPVA